MEAVNVMSMENVCASPSARLTRRASICRASSSFQAFSECCDRLFPSLSTDDRTTRYRDSNTEQPQFSAANRAA